MTCKDGSRKNIEWGLVSVGIKNVVYGIDLTRRTRAEEERENLRSQLLQSQKMEAVGTLAAGIAHDFNNMLQVILGYSEMLFVEKKTGERGREELQRIIKTAIDARDLVQKIRVFSRRADVDLVAHSLNRQIDEVCKILPDKLPKTINIDVRLGKDLAFIKADHTLMDQLVMNLAINSSEAMPDGGTLTIETQNLKLGNDFCQSHAGLKPGLYVVLTVSDTGRGMSKELLDKIFDPFFSTKQRDFRRGTGLGLSVVQGIVEQHAGCITVESEVGLGTTFRIYFPSMTAEEIPQVAAKIELPIGGDETILVAEDEEAVRELLARFLERLGYKVLTAGDGREAVELYQKEQGNISLVILDIVMPRMNGKQCLSELLKINPLVKVLISSGVAQDDLVKDVVDVGAKGTLIKPYKMKALHDKVREILDGD